MAKMILNITVNVILNKLHSVLKITIKFLASSYIHLEHYAVSVINSGMFDREYMKAI